MTGGPALRGAVVVALAATVAAQQAPARAAASVLPARGTASMSGTVLNDATGRRLRRATIGLSSTDNSLRLVAATGDDGAFGFTDLPAGRYAVSGSRVGYVTVNYGAKRAGRPGVAITLADGEQKVDVTLRLPPGAIVSGTVRTTSGEPMPGARIIILRRSVRFDTGESTLVPADAGNGTGGRADTTDNRGDYRCFGLPADDYYVVAMPGGPLLRGNGDLREMTAAEFDWAARILREPNGAPVATPPPAPGPVVDYAPVFYPGVATAARASTVSLRAGQELDGIDIVVDLTPTAKISGTVSLASGGPLPQLVANLIAHDPVPGMPSGGFGTLPVDRTGKFSSNGLQPGEYTILVRPVLPPNGRVVSAQTAALFGTGTVTVNGSDVDTSITLEPGVTVSGRVAFEGNAPSPTSAGIHVNLVAKRTSLASFGVPAGVTDATGAFTFTGVPPGSYHLAANGPFGWQVRSASGGGQEALDGFIDVVHGDITDAIITLTNHLTEVSGRLLDAAGRPASEYTIIIFPTDRGFWSPFSRRIQSAQPSSDGRFRVANLPPGDYRIAAVTDVEPGEWYSSAFLTEIMSSSRPFTLAEGQKLVDDLRISGGS